MSTSFAASLSELRSLIEAFLQERFEAKAEKLAPEDPKRDELRAQFQFDAWIQDAARRVAQLQVVTHSLKPVHPDAKGSNLYVTPETLKTHDLVGSHVLAENFSADVVGNAAALDVYKFLRLEHAGRSILKRALENDTELSAALSDDPEQAQAWMHAFAAIIEARGTATSHTLAKQLYWLAGEDPASDADYHLLAPLYATALAHQVFLTINEDRFGEATKQARQARREGLCSDTGFRDYPNLAVQKFGGTKPQNISQLNSERGGNNYLLASLPPRWVSREVQAPYFTDSVFPRFGRHREVRWLVSRLRELLLADPSPNRETRNLRDEYVGALIDELVIFASAFAMLTPGWSASPDCRLVEAEALWLDPGREDHEFAARRAQGAWTEEIRQRFAGWLNHQLADALPVGDAEYQFWANQMKGKLDALQEVLPYV